MTDYAQTIPILASLNITESACFYSETLGFEVLFQRADYLIVRRDSMELHFWLTDEKHIANNTACYIRGGQVVDLYKDFSTKDFGNGRLSDFAVRPWNMKEFYVHDPHGNLLKFGCAPEEVG